jgi:hypothetical protein
MTTPFEIRFKESSLARGDTGNSAPPLPPLCNLGPRPLRRAMSRRSRLISRRLNGSTAIMGEASANQVYDDEASKKLLDEINRIASNLGVDEVIAGAVQAHLKKIGEIPADEPGEGDGEGVDPAGSLEPAGEASALETFRAEAKAESGFFYLNRS